MSAVVFNVELEPGEPTLFDRREDADTYAGLFAGVEVREELVMDAGLAAGYISEAEADLEAEDRGAGGGRG